MNLGRWPLAMIALLLVPLAVLLVVEVVGSDDPDTPQVNATTYGGTPCDPDHEDATQQVALDFDETVATQPNLGGLLGVWVDESSTCLDPWWELYEDGWDVTSVRVVATVDDGDLYPVLYDTTVSGFDPSTPSVPVLVPNGYCLDITATVTATGAGGKQAATWTATGHRGYACNPKEIH